MLLLRVAMVLAAAAVGASLLAFLFSQDRRYLGIAWLVVKYVLVFVFVLLVLMFLERAFAPVAGLV